MAVAYKFMANYHFKKEHHGDAYVAAQKCLEYPESKEEGKSLLRQINALASAEPPGERIEGHDAMEESVIEAFPLRSFVADGQRRI